MLLFFHSLLLEDKPMPAPQPMEPMDSYLCILLSIDVITTSRAYTQQEICGYVAQNQTYVNSVMSDPVALKQVQDEYMTDAQNVEVIDKQEDCP